MQFPADCRLGIQPPPWTRCLQHAGRLLSAVACSNCSCSSTELGQAGHQPTGSRSFISCTIVIMFIGTHLFCISTTNWFAKCSSKSSWFSWTFIASAIILKLITREGSRKGHSLDNWHMFRSLGGPHFIKFFFGYFTILGYLTKIRIPSFP